MHALELSTACSGQKTLYDMLSRSSSTSKTTLATTGHVHASMIDTTTETNNESTVTTPEEIEISGVGTCTTTTCQLTRLV